MIDNTLQRIQKVFKNTLGVDPETITQNSTKDDIEGWDSLGHLRVMMAVEKDFGVKFTTDQVVRVTCASDIIKLVL